MIPSTYKNNTPRCKDCTVCIRRNNSGNVDMFCGYATYDVPDAYRRIVGPDALKTSPMWCPKRKCNGQHVE